MSQQQESTLLDSVKAIAEQGFAEWHQEHNDAKFGLPTRGKLYGALIVLANLEDRAWAFSELDDAVSTDKGKFFGERSIYRHTASRVSSILEEHEQGHLVPSSSRGEQGRTSTGTKRAGLELIQLFNNALQRAPEDQKDEQGSALIAYLYTQVFALLQAYHDLGGIEVSFKATESIATYISQLLEGHLGNPGAVLQHLVGAKLELRFEGQSISLEHHSSSTADVQTGRLGDFEIGSTVFHVTKSANDDHYRKALQNAENGRKVYILVPESVLGAIKAFAEQFRAGFSKRVDIFSIEQFVAQNLDELALFDRSEALRKLQNLLEKYNELIENHESDKSLKIIIPDFGVT